MIRFFLLNMQTDKIPPFVILSILTSLFHYLKQYSNKKTVLMQSRDQTEG